MSNLIGNKPNQVPTNADLGTLAFLDKEALDYKSTTWANLPAANSFGYGYIRVTDVGNNGSLWYSNSINWVHESPIILAQKATGYLVPSLASANAATYSQTGTTITVTSTGHAIPATTYNGCQVYLVIASGLATTGWFTNFQRVDANTFTCVSTVSQSTSGIVNTNTAEITVTPVTTTIPASLIGANGSLSISGCFTYINSANSKTIKFKLGSSAIYSKVRTTTVSDAFNGVIYNRNSESVNETVISVNSSESAGNSATAPTIFSVNTATANDVTYTITLAAANEYAALNYMRLSVNPSA